MILVSYFLNCRGMIPTKVNWQEISFFFFTPPSSERWKRGNHEAGGTSNQEVPSWMVTVMITECSIRHVGNYSRPDCNDSAALCSPVTACLPDAGHRTAKKKAFELKLAPWQGRVCCVFLEQRLRMWHWWLTETHSSQSIANRVPRVLISKPTVEEPQIGLVLHNTSRVLSGLFQTPIFFFFWASVQKGLYGTTLTTSASNPIKGAQVYR